MFDAFLKLDELQNFIDFENSIINIVDNDNNIDPSKSIRSLNDIHDIRQSNKLIGRHINQIQSSKTLSKEEIKIRIDEFCKANKTYSWNAEKIVLNKNFDLGIDIFKLSIFSNMIYVSDKLISKIIDLELPEVKFRNWNEIKITWNQKS